MQKIFDEDLNILFTNLDNYVSINTRNISIGIEDVTQYYIEHLFCDFQTFLVCVPMIKDIPEVRKVFFSQNKLYVKVLDKEDIIIELNNYCISISLFGIIGSTPVNTVEKIMNIFRVHINSLIDINKRILTL